MPTDDRTARWNRYWDKKSRTYDREIGFFDRHLFGDSRQWVCSQATGDVLEVAIGTGLNLAFYPELSVGRLRVSSTVADGDRDGVCDRGRHAYL